MIHPYASRAYAQALAGVDALPVPAWGGHVVRRPIDQGLADAAGVYPLAVFAPDAEIAEGLAQLGEAGLVSVVLVPDPVLHPVEALDAFEVRRAFKAHHLIDPAQGAYAPTKHHRQYIRRGHRRCRVEVVSLAQRLDDWRRLYAGLVARRGISGAADFPDAYFEALAADPRMVAFAAFSQEACVGMAIWFEAQGVVYNHLGAADDVGYAEGANYAIYDAAICHFEGQGVVNLGGGAGLPGQGDGLSAFKRGFANAEAQAYVCGAILDPGRYAELSAGRSSEGFFPAYRAPAS